MEQRAALWSAVMGTVGAAIAVILLGVRFRQATSVIYGFGFGVAIVSLALAVGMIGLAYTTDGDADNLYIYPATVTSASVLLLVSADNLVAREGHNDFSIVLVGGAVLITTGFLLVFISEFNTCGINTEK